MKIGWWGICRLVILGLLQCIKFELLPTSSRHYLQEINHSLPSTSKPLLLLLPVDRQIRLSQWGFSHGKMVLLQNYLR